MCETCFGTTKKKVICKIKQRLGIGIGVVVLILIIVFGVSFVILDIGKYGLLYNHNTQHVKPQHYKQGRYLLGPQYGFVTYDRFYQLMEFSDDSDQAVHSRLDCWSKNGQNVYLDLSFYVVVNPDMLHQFYMKYGTNWKGLFVQMAVGIIKDTANLYNTTTFFTDRATIKNALHTAVNNTFFTQSNGAISVPQFQLRRVAADAVFQQAVEAKVVAKQDTQKYREIKILEIRNKDITEIQENATNYIRNYTAGITKQAKVIEANALVNAQKIRFQDEVAAYLDFDSNLNLNADQKSLLELIYVDMIRNIDSSKTQFVFGLSPTASIS